eukprot:4576073-Prymnesium_polylepis.1
MRQGRWRRRGDVPRPTATRRVGDSSGQRSLLWAERLGANRSVDGSKEWDAAAAARARCS